MHGVLRSFYSAAFCALFLMLFPANASAFSIFGITLFEDAAASDAAAVIAHPQPYVLRFDVAPDVGELRDQLANASTLFGGQGTPASGAAGLLASARADYRNLVSTLYEQGYYGGSVSIRIVGQEVNDLAPDINLPKPVNVVVSVDPGPIFVFGTVNVRNAVDQQLSQSELIAGAVAKSDIVKRATRTEVSAWRAAGYPKARVEGLDIIADHTEQKIDVSFTLSPGTKANLGVVSVDGSVEVDSDFIIKQSGLITGALYNPSHLKRARERLAALDVFSAIKIKEADEVQPDGTLPITIAVQERKQRRVGVGTSFSTVDGFGEEAFWQHRNLFGQAEKLRLDAKISGIAFPIDSADFDYAFGATFTKPGVFTPDTNFDASVLAQRTVLERYTQTSVEGSIGYSHKFSSELTAATGVEAMRANFTDAAYGKRNFSVFGTYGSFEYDTRDDPTNATEGMFVNLTAEPYYEAEYGNAAIKLSTEGRMYLGFGADDRFVLAGRLKLGLLYGPSVAQTPPEKLFFAGGGGSLRGYAFRSVGVDGPGGSVTGGKFLTEASVEARLKLTETVGLVGFADAGYVAADHFMGLGEGTRFGVGAGLRYFTDFGPLRLDLAFPINKRADDPNYAIYAGIGQAF